MRKVLVTFSLLFILGVLAGCMEMLPFGNDGSSEEPVEAEEVNENETEGTEENAESAMTEEVAAEESTEGELATEADTNDATTNQCPEDNFERLTEHLIAGFYIPECAILQGVTKIDTHVEGQLLIENGNYEEVYDGYLAYFGENIHSDRIDMGMKSAELHAYLLGDDQNNTRIRISTNSEGAVSVNVYQELPE